MAKTKKNPKDYKIQYIVTYGSEKHHLQVDDGLKAKSKKEAIEKARRKIKVKSYREY